MFRRLKWVDNCYHQIRQRVHEYEQSFEALKKLLPGNDNRLAKFQVITKDDLKMHGDVTEENRLGQKADHMAWFWRIDHGQSEHSSIWMQECEFPVISISALVDCICRLPSNLVKGQVPLRTMG